MTVRAPFLISLALLAAPSGAFAAPGDLDPGYGAGGVATATVASDRFTKVGLPVDVLVSSVGAAVVTVVSGSDGSNIVAVVTRHSAAGAVDTDFSGDGRIEIGVGDGDTIPVGIVEQPDGKLVVGLVTRIGRSAAVSLVRLTTSGVYDATFGGDGIVSVSTPELDAYGLIQLVPGNGIVGPVVHPDGRLSMVGRRPRPDIAATAIDLVLVAALADGSVPPAFAGGSLSTTRAVGFVPTSLVADGTRVVVAGPTATQGAEAVRLDADGDPDPAFGALGQLSLTGFGAGGGPIHLAATSAGLLVAGEGPAGAWLVRRVSASGATDPAFGTGGTTTISAPGGQINGIGVRGATTEVILGGTDLAGNRVLRKLDFTTGTVIPFAATAEAAGLTGSAIAVGPGQVLIAGRPLGSTRDGGIVAFRSLSGVADGTFTQVVISTGSGPIRGVGPDRAIVAPDGSVYSATHVTSGPSNLIALHGFAPGGVAGQNVDVPGLTSQEFVSAVAVDGGGRVYVATVASSPNRVVVSRHQPNGTGDPSFAPVVIPTPSFASISRLLADEAGLVVVVNGQLGGSVRCRLTRYATSGAPDPAFGLAGSIELGVTCIDVVPVGTGLAVGSERISGADSAAEIRRYDAAGDPVLSFSGDAVMTIPLGHDESGVLGLAARPGGALAAFVTRVAVGGGGRSADVAAVRADGVLDPAFGNGGFARVGEFAASTFPTGRLASAPDGRLVVALNSGVSGGDAISLVRVTTNGVAQPLAAGARAVVLGPQARPEALSVLVDGRIMLAAAGDARLRAARILSDRPVIASRRFDRRGRKSVRVAGRVSPLGGRTTWWVEYGRTKTYGKRTKKIVIGPASARTVRATLRFLRRNSVYHYRLVAQNGSGRTIGRDRVFRTRR